MREPGFEEFADLWQESGDADRAAVEALARRARRQGRLLAYADIAVWSVVIGGILFGMLMTPQPAMIAVGVFTIAFVSWMNWRRRKLRQMATTLKMEGRDAFLESSIQIATANLRREKLTLAFLPLAIAAGLTARFIFKSGGHLDHPLASVLEWATSPKGMAALTIFLLLFLRALRSRRRLQAELRKLEELRKEYEE